MLPEVHSNDDFILFLKWLKAEKDFRVDSIIDVVEKPHHYCEQYDLFLEYLYDK